MRRLVFSRGVALAFIVIAAFLLEGCSKKLVKEEMSDRYAATVQDPLSSEIFAAAEEPVKEERQWVKGKYIPLGEDERLNRLVSEEGRLYTVYFDFNRYTVDDESMLYMNENAKWLKINPLVDVILEGHADERGETMYNLSLGDRRARGVKKYMEDLGIRSERLTTLSYGEEKPADPEHNEEAWSKNRRVEFMVIQH